MSRYRSRAGGWRTRTLAPDSYRLVLALAAPKGIAALPEVLDAARLSQTRVTRICACRRAARSKAFCKRYSTIRQRRRTRPAPARGGALGRGADPRLSPAVHPETGERGRSGVRVQLRLHQPVARRPVAQSGAGATGATLLDHGHDTGRMLEDGATVFRVFRDGLSCSELSVTPLGGALFGAQATPLLDRLAWGERAVACCSIGCCGQRRRAGRASGCTTVRWMWRTSAASTRRCWNWNRGSRPCDVAATARKARGGRARRAGCAYRGAVHADADGVGRGHSRRAVFLRAGVGRKTTGSYYTPHAFVRFLVRETLAPQIAEPQSRRRPNPGAILALKVVDPAPEADISWWRHAAISAMRCMRRAACATRGGCR